MDFDYWIWQQEFWLPLKTWLELNPNYVAFSIFLVSFLESLALAGLLVPGVFLLVGITAVAGGGALDLWSCLIYAFIGAVLGDFISFLLGKHYHQQIKNLRPFRNNPHWITNGEVYFKKHGGKSVVIGRFFGPVRAVIPLVAGMMDMPTMRFFMVNVISAIGWAPTYIIPGYLVGLSVKNEVLPAEVFTILMWSILISIVVFYILVKTHQQMQPGTWLYRRFKVWARQNMHINAVWNGLLNRRPGDTVFPLSKLVVLILAFFLFLLLSVLVQFTEVFSTMDMSIHEWFKTIQYEQTRTVMVAITMLGDKTLLLLLSTIVVLWFIANKFIIAAVHWVVGIFLTYLAGTGFKLLFAIPRPVSESLFFRDYSYPSGHVLGVTALYGLLVLFIGREMSAKRRWFIYSIPVLIILAVSVSRLYLGVHWLTDELAGLFIGLVIISGVSLHYNRHDVKPFKFNMSIIIAVLMAIATFVFYYYYYFPIELEQYRSLLS